VASLASAILPGLGQVLSRAYGRGLVLIGSFATSLGLLAWRIRLAARRETELLSIIQKAFTFKPITLILSIVFLLLYIAIIIDAYMQARRPRRAFPGLFLIVLIVYFGLGWQIGEIDPLSLLTGGSEGSSILLEVMWPWEKATTREEEILIAIMPIEVPCSENPPLPPEEVEGVPYLAADPSCGIATDVERNPGTLIRVWGSDFKPGIAAEVWWEDPLGNEFRQRMGFQSLTVTPDGDGAFEFEAPIPYRFIPPSAAEGPLMWEVQVRQSVAVGPLIASEELMIAIEQMVVTIFLGMMATFFGIIIAIPISFLAARNLMSASPFTLGIYYISRLILNIIRSIEPLIWTVIAIIVVGFGPFGGIIALTVHSIAALAKLYSESIESIDPGPIEAIQATGANWLQIVMFGVVPQIIPPFVSFTIYRWDINVRMSTVIGLVGGGGIGFVLIQWIRLFDYKAAGIAVWFIAITVAILDFVSAEIRKRYV
jgi:phosphonate transport system permease protein